MAFVQTIEGDVYIAGALVVKAMTVPAGTVADAQVAVGASIDAAKLQSRLRCVHAQESATTAADQSTVIHTVTGSTGIIREFKAGLVDACAGAATVTFDLKKNGASVLSAPISLDSGDADYAIVAGVISSANLIENDVLEVTIDATAGGGTIGKGAFAVAVIDETPL